MGIDHVGLGSDFMRQLVEAGIEDPAPSDAYLEPGAHIDDDLGGVSGPEHYQEVIDALRDRNYRDGHLEAIAAGNFLRLLDAGLRD